MRKAKEIAIDPYHPYESHSLSYVDALKLLSRASRELATILSVYDKQTIRKWYLLDPTRYKTLAKNTMTCMSRCDLPGEKESCPFESIQFMGLDVCGMDSVRSIPSPLLLQASGENYFIDIIDNKESVHFLFFQAIALETILRYHMKSEKNGGDKE